MMTTTEYICPGCAENGMADECWHTAEMWALATAIRDAVERLHPDANGWEKGSVAGAWAFIDDVDGLGHAEFGEPPYSVTMMHPNPSNDVDAVGVINGRHLFVSRSGDSGGWMEYLGDLGGFLAVPSDTAGVIAARVRANCTPSSEAYAKGGDAIVAAVADWIESPPDWVDAPWVAGAKEETR